MARVRISIGIIALLLSATLYAQPKLVVAQTADGHWRTDGYAAWNFNCIQAPGVVIECPGLSIPTFVNFSTCVIPGASSVLSPGESFMVKDVGAWQCSTPLRQFYLLDANTVVTEYTLLRFDDGVTSTSFAVPPINPIPPGQWRRFAPVKNDVDAMTTVNLFPVGVGRLFFDLFDEKNNPAGSEWCDYGPPVTQCALTTKLSVGSLKVTNVDYVLKAKPLYGFVGISRRDGGSAVVYPFMP